MAGLDPAIHVFLRLYAVKDVDARDKPGHDDVFVTSTTSYSSTNVTVSATLARDVR